MGIWSQRHGGAEFPYSRKGEIGVGLAEYQTVDGRVKGIAAFNDIPLPGDGDAAGRGAALSQETRQAYQELYGIMEEMVESEGYEIVHRGQAVEQLRNIAGHEEDFLIPALRSRSGEMAEKSVAIVGVPQRTICGRCFANWGGGPGGRTAAPGILTGIDEGRNISATVIGYGAAERIWIP